MSVISEFFLKIFYKEKSIEFYFQSASEHEEYRAHKKLFVQRLCNSSVVKFKTELILTYCFQFSIVSIKLLERSVSKLVHHRLVVAVKFIS